MPFEPGLAQTRFGYGRSPEVAGPVSVDDMMARLLGPDVAAQRFPIAKDEATIERAFLLFQQKRDAKQVKAGTPERAKLEAAFKKAQKAAQRDAMGAAGQEFMRRTWSQDALRERMVAFWADHFSVRGKNLYFRIASVSYVDATMRPHVAGQFEDMLIAAVTHPQMIHYLDQTGSVGPNSPYANDRRAKNKLAGLNENLAREILELHTLGVQGSYKQKDVRQLAELMTGMTTGVGKSTIFNTRRAEPGAQVVLGKTYGAGRARIDDIHAVLRDLARHPDTARHLAQEMAVHFISDHPDAELVAAMQQRYLETNGNLGAMVAAMLAHPASWQRPETNVRNFKQPDLFVSSAMRALAVTPDQMQKTRPKWMTRFIFNPLQNMGQPWRAPLGPDGFEESDAHWLSPQGMGARLQWALAAPTALLGDLPDPRAFLRITLGEDAPADVRFAANAAENKREGIALVLMSPAFQRM